MTKDDSAELPSEEDHQPPEYQSPVLERRKKPIVHPSAPAPLPKDYGPASSSHNKKKHQNRNLAGL